jgi:GTPase SAR1 family protein
VLNKPKIAVVGHSDVGKSKLINSILGIEKMPTAWTPTTSITVYIKHINDRPGFIEEEAWVFRASWDETRLKDEDYCREWKLAGGNADLLIDYGTRQGDMYGQNDAGAAVIFVDSDILKDCDVIDLPGFGTGDRVEDDAMTLKAKEYADIVIYMSHAGQFMRGAEIEYLKEAINALNVVENIRDNPLKPLSNLFIVASHAHTVDGGNERSLDTILDSGCDRLLKTIPDGFWDDKESMSGYTYDCEVIRDRFYTFSTDTAHLRKSFENELAALVETLPQIITEKAKAFISQFIAAAGVNMDREIEEYVDIINERHKYELLLQAIEKNEPERDRNNQQRRMNLLWQIRELSDLSVSEVANFYKTTVSTDEVVKIIRWKGFNKKREDTVSLVSYINSLLQCEMQKVLKHESFKLKKKVDEYVADFEGGIVRYRPITEVQDVNLCFDATRAFASGLVGLATFGGLSLWASSLGNLGAYVLVGKGVTFLSTLGISVGGTTAVVSAIAAIGGPVVLGVGLSVLTALSAFAVLSGGWEEQLARKIVAEYHKSGCMNKFQDSIELFWAETEIAFNLAADALENEWKRYRENLKEMISTYNVGEIKSKIRNAEEFKNFLSGIPL